MRRILFLFALMAMSMGITLSSCTSNDAPDSVTTTLTIDTNSVNVEADGGKFTIGYSLTGGYDGVEPKSSCDASWVKEISTVDSTISFTVEPNSEAIARHATLTIKYPGIEDYSVNIIQEAGDSLFEMVISNKTTTGCQSTIKPKDDEMAYIVYMAEVAYFWASNITTAEQLFQDDYNGFKQLAEEYNSNLGQFMIINQIAFYGQSDIAWQNMTPNTDYVLYAYGIEFNEDMTDYTLSTPISYMIVRLESGKLQTIEFDVNITVDGPEVFYEFEPIGWSGKYYIEVLAENDFMYLPEGVTPDDDYCQKVVDTWLANLNQYMSSGFSGEQLYNIMCLEGKDSYSEIRLSDTNYMMSFYAIEMIDGLPQVVSRPYIVHFKTEVVEPSDMTFDINVDDVYTRVADIKISPTKDDPYTISLIRKSEVPEGSNRDIINWLIGTYNMSSYKGDVTAHVNTLAPETEYSLLIFGYYGGIITTDLFRVDIKTDAEGECENSVVRVDFMGPYSPTELAAHYPDALNGMEAMYEQYGYYIMWAEIVTEKPANDVFIGHYDMDEVALGDGYIFNDITSYSSQPLTTLTARSGVEFVMCGVTMDYRGNYSELWKSEPFTYVYDTNNKRPIEELVEKITSSSTAGKLMLAAPGERAAMEQTISVMKH